ncbi:MAG TPA: DUF2066 domain-containing protein [Gammaproteobacteria bacterium]|nr:DUF2066 domain-containing protein [Gammaproteobacteria bacterium]
MKLRKYLILYILFDLFSLSTCWALDSENLYEVQLIAISKEEGERLELMREGLRQTFVRISGKKEVLKEVAIQQALKNPLPYVTQYQYQQDMFRVLYNRKLISALLNQTASTVLQDERPSMIVWISMEVEDDRRWVGIEQDPSIVALVEKIASSRAQPIVFPLLDLEDLEKMNLKRSAITLGDTQHASKRYDADILLVGRLIQNKDQKNWEGDWKLFTPKKDAHFKTEIAPLNQTVTQGMEKMMDTMTQLYTAPDTENLTQASSFIIQIENIRTGGDHAEILRFLKNIPSIDDVEVLSITPTRTAFQITPKANRSATTILHALKTNPQLTMRDSSFMHAENKEEITYQWKGQI